MKRLTPSQLQDLLDRYQSGTHQKDLAIQYDLNPRSVERILKRQGVFQYAAPHTSGEQASQVIKLYQQGSSSSTIAKELDLSASTIFRILRKHQISVRPAKETKPQKHAQQTQSIKPTSKKLAKWNDISAYGTTYIPSYESHLLIKQYLETLTLEEKEPIIDFLFDFYRANGFPYPTLTTDQIVREFSLLCDLDPNTIANGNILNLFNQTGIPIFKHFAPHFYEVNTGRDNRQHSTIDTFNDDTKLRKVIENRIGYNNKETFNMTGNMLKQGIRNSKIGYQASIFFPSVAKFIYAKHTQPNDIVYDYSMGFGQRLLGAASTSHPLTYVGADPLDKTVKSNQDIFEFLKTNIPTHRLQADLRQCGSEEFCDPQYEGKVKLAFSSPPYFNLEKYSDDKSQAYANGSYSEFINDWWKTTVSNIDRLLTSDGIFALNIKDKLEGLNLAEDMCQVVENAGFALSDIYQIQLSRNKEFRQATKDNQSKTHKFEPVFLFRRR